MASSVSSNPKHESPGRRSPVNRGQAVAVAKVLVWSIPLTVLIWIWAEREQVLFPNSPNVTNVPVLIRSNKLFVQTPGNGLPTVNLKISGPQDAIDKVRDELTVGQTDRQRGILIDIGDSLTPGPQKINVKGYIQGMDLFKQAGVTVEESQPADLDVTVDNIKSRDVIVEAPPGLPITGVPVFTPQKVTVTGPERVIDRELFNRGLLKVYASLKDQPEMQRPGDHQLSSVSVAIPGDPQDVKINPNMVSARFTVRSADETYTIRDGIPVYVEAPPGFFDKYKVDVNNGNPSIADIEVTGPADAVEQIKNNSFFVKAVLDLKEDDVNTTEKPLRYILPEGVRVTDQSRGRPIDYKVTRRETPG